MADGNKKKEDFDGVELNLPPGTLLWAAQKFKKLPEFSEEDILRLVHIHLTKGITVGECTSSNGGMDLDDQS